MRSALPTLKRTLRDIGREFHSRGWVLGTSGNLSVVVSRRPLKLMITASSVSKGAIRPRDLLVVGDDGHPVRKTSRLPSAETLLHVAVARARDAGAVLHTHSVWSTILSEIHAPHGGLRLSGFEMLKGLEGVQTNDHAEWMPILENDQEIPRLAERVCTVLADAPAVHGFLLRKHGLYTWGEDLEQARRHVEIFEFLLEATARLASARFLPGDTHGSDQNS